MCKATLGTPASALGIASTHHPLAPQDTTLSLGLGTGARHSVQPWQAAVCVGHICLATTQEEA